MENQIPKIFHQIWLGGEEKMPDEHKLLRDIMLALHPDWEYQFWSEENFPPCINAEYYNLALKDCYKSDIIRYEILAIHGGVYIDTDYLFYKSINPLINGNNNFFVEENEHWCTNSLMGVAPNHPIMWACIRELPVRFRLYPNRIGYERVGPGLLTAVLENFKETAVILPKPLFYSIFSNMVSQQLSHSFPHAYASHLWNNIEGLGVLNVDTLKAWLQEAKRRGELGEQHVGLTES